MLLINKVWPLLIVGISKLAPSMFQSWLRPCMMCIYVVSVYKNAASSSQTTLYI